MTTMRERARATVDRWSQEVGAAAGVEAYEQEDLVKRVTALLEAVERETRTSAHLEAHAVLDAEVIRSCDRARGSLDPEHVRSWNRRASYLQEAADILVVRALAPAREGEK